MLTSTTPTKRAQKAGRRAAKALAVFESAATELERASAEHLSVSDELVQAGTSLYKQAEVDYADLTIAAEKAYDAAVAAAERAYDAAFEAAEQHATALETAGDIHAAQAGQADDAAYKAQVQADKLRSVLSV